MKLVIYQTSDLHGYIYPTNYVKDQPLGFLKIASYISNDEKSHQQIEEFLIKVNPKLALIGVGKDNKFGHPNDEVLERLQKYRNKSI